MHRIDEQLLTIRGGAESDFSDPVHVLRVSIIDNYYNPMLFLPLWSKHRRNQETGPDPMRMFTSMLQTVAGVDD